MAARNVLCACIQIHRTALLALPPATKGLSASILHVTSRVIVLPDFAFVLTSNPLSILDLAGSCCRGSRNSRAPIKAKTLVSQWKNTERCHAVPCTAPKPLWVRRNSPVLIAKEVQGNTIEHTCNPQNSSCIQTATFARKISYPRRGNDRNCRLCERVQQSHLSLSTYPHYLTAWASTMRGMPCSNIAPIRRELA